jgi:predicted GIY-YIG superfamily endonuclease
MFLVYILRSDNFSYVGMTNDFLRRFRQHNKELKGGAKYTSKRTEWYPICIIDGFSTMKEAMQCEWAVKHSRSLRGPHGRVKDQDLTIYVDDEFAGCLQNDVFETKELYWRA